MTSILGLVAASIGLGFSHDPLRTGIGYRSPGSSKSSINSKRTRLAETPHIETPKPLTKRAKRRAKGRKS